MRKTSMPPREVTSRGRGRPSKVAAHVKDEWWLEQKWLPTALCMYFHETLEGTSRPGALHWTSLQTSPFLSKTLRHILLQNDLISW